MSSSVLEIALARRIADALRAGGSDRLELELAYIAGQLARGETDMTYVIEQLAAGVSPYHVFGQYQLPWTHAAIEVPRAVMPPGTMTETVIGIIQAVSAAEQPRTMLDVGCGIGVLGIAALMTCEPMRGILLDIDQEAAACAGRNLARLGLAGRGWAVRCDGASSIRPASIDLLIANLPFVPDAQFPFLPARFKIHTPMSAVLGGTDGLDVIRQLAPAMRAAAAPACHLILQVGNADQKAAAAGLLATWWEPIVHEPGRHANVLVAVRRPR